MQSQRLIIFLLVAIFQVGCSSTDPNDMFAARFDSRMKKLAVLYSTFQARNNWTGPADDNEFREYIGSISETRLARLEISKRDIDVIFNSERDGQPYRIRWSITGGNGVPPQPILFEAQGANGSYLVAFTNGTTEEFSKAEYDKLWAGEGDDGSMIGFTPGSNRQ